MKKKLLFCLLSGRKNNEFHAIIFRNWSANNDEDASIGCLYLSPAKKLTCEVIFV